MSPPEPGGLRAGEVLTRRYLLLEPIARGGMSVIWRAFDQSLQRLVAVKLLDGEFGADRGGRELMRREARATARLIHPDAIEVYDYGETVTSHGRLAAYVVMRLLEGRPLSDRISAGPLPWAEAALIAARLANVLAAAHGRGIVHRDVTAENVLLTADGAKLLDFGIAAFIGEEDEDRASDYGTPPYVAPERLTGMTAAPASDVYALGVLLFEMLTGGTPYPERTWEEIENVRRVGPPPAACAPGLPSEVAALCRDCLSHGPEDRPKAQELADGLTAALAGARTVPGAVAMRWTVVATAAALVAGALVWHQVTAAPERRPSPTTALGTATARPAPVTPLGPVPGRPDPGLGTAPAATPTTRATPIAPTTRPRPVATRETGRGRPDPRAVRTENAPRTPPVVKMARSSVPTLGQSVRGFNALLAEGEDRGGIRPDVALDLRQVLAGSVCCSRDLTPVRGKIADRHREGSLSDELRRALESQLGLVAMALTG
ncbi:serine/threonine-protein kinase [Streptosporangium roseum]|uniref:non-specific serine/threonine protein kinase n=1 Tax=Streptosporangium roseum (strain ATCC 12428 / DSM 43021 / JCM 3005 / KCTC 9067 / NCIMB 10171 / NRRL 2505 / NI 9100) TaxID=479432 RepID=D2B816_STRRD|nr:serine/threonine-protein kinase [Streptosporangium roseum]ACZ83947.1 Serine/threonine protein kinase-like protein [Streptosporangium roseum DSM 43021]